MDTSRFSDFQSQSTSENDFRYQSLKNFGPVSRRVQSHLKRVYLSLGCALITSAVGVYLDQLWNIGGFITATYMGSILWLLFTPPYEESERVALLMAAAFFKGASIGPLIGLVIEIDPSILISGFVATAIAFGCFCAAAMLFKRRAYIYLGGLMSSGIAILFWLHFASSLFGGSMAFFQSENPELYSGLLLILGYIVVDTQFIIERARLGDLDYVKHSLMLFIDFAELFVRFLLILLKSRAEMDEDRENVERRKRSSNRLEFSFR